MVSYIAGSVSNAVSLKTNLQNKNILVKFPQTFGKMTKKHEFFKIFQNVSENFSEADLFFFRNLFENKLNTQ